MTKGTAKNRVFGLVKSQRGASFSIALLLMLVCVALSAAVLAAATAASGRFADQGDMDQRYYAVSSAAELFRDSLGEDEELSFEAVQQRTGTKGVTGAVTWSNDVSLASGLTPTPAAADRKGFDFLEKITWYALFGQRLSAPASLGSVSTGDSWVEPFTSTWWGGSPSKTFTYTIEPVSDDLKDGNADVEVTARLSNIDADWVLELDFHNLKNKRGEVADPTKGEVFHLYMRLGATVNSDIVPTDSDTTRQRKTTVTWQLQQITPGKGL